MEETPRDTESVRVTRGGCPPRQNGPAIRALREKDGWTQTALAKAAAHPAGHPLGHRERDVQRRYVVTLNVLARKLRVPVAAIMRDRDDEDAAADVEDAAAL